MFNVDCSLELEGKCTLLHVHTERRWEKEERELESLVSAEFRLCGANKHLRNQRKKIETHSFDKTCATQGGNLVCFLCEHTITKV